VSLESNFSLARQKIEAACQRAGRDPASVTLLAITKGQPPEVIRAAAALGQVYFGESKVQEAKAKIPLSPSRLRWHLVGHLQSNKCRDAVFLFEMIHSIDSMELAQEVNRWADKSGKTLPILLEVNLAGEASKFGFKPQQVALQLSAIHELRRLELRGLMTLAPWSPDPEKARPIFRQLRELKLDCEQKLGAPLPHLSMGMSGDFEVAIEEGATFVRLGTTLFGPRGLWRSRSIAPETSADDGP